MKTTIRTKTVKLLNKIHHTTTSGEFRTRVMFRAFLSGLLAFVIAFIASVFLFPNATNITTIMLYSVALLILSSLAPQLVYIGPNIKDKKGIKTI